MSAQRSTYVTIIFSSSARSSGRTGADSPFVRVVQYGIRFKTDDEAETFVANLAGEAAKRLRGIGRVARAITLKILTRAPDAPIEAPKFMGHGVVVTSNRSKNVSGPGGTGTDSGDIMGAAAVALLREGAAPAFELRGIGIVSETRMGMSSWRRS